MQHLSATLQEAAGFGTWEEAAAYGRARGLNVTEGGDHLERL